MRTLLQIEASRINGAKSRGPVSEAGKRISAANSANSPGPVSSEGRARVSQNATRHGLLADSVVFEGESEERFSAFLSVLENEFHPEPGIESALLHVIAVAHWRRLRAWSLEKMQYAQETRKRLEASGDDGETPIGQLSRSFRSLADETIAGPLLNRYETRFSREFDRALACLKKHRADKKREREEQRQSQESKKKRVRTPRRTLG